MILKERSGQSHERLASCGKSFHLFCIIRQAQRMGADIEGQCVPPDIWIFTGLVSLKPSSCDLMPGHSLPRRCVFLWSGPIVTFLDFSPFFFCSAFLCMRRSA